MNDYISHKRRNDYKPDGDFMIADNVRRAVKYDHTRVNEHGYDVCYACGDEWPCVARQLLWSLETVERKLELTKWLAKEEPDE